MKNILLLLLGLVVFGISCADNTSTTKTSKQETTENPTVEKTKVEGRKHILFFGNSLTAAYNLDPSEGFTTIIQQRLDSLNLNYKVINAGLSGETTAGGNERIDWVIRQKVDIFVLELGANDGLRGIDPEASYKNLQSMITKVKTKYPKVKIVLAGMLAPPNMGDKFTAEFKNMYPKLAKENETELIPFFLEGVAGQPELNLPDGIHPNVEGQKIVAENVWMVLKDIL
jgi:acyl-CoA thioesterase-1